MIVPHHDRPRLSDDHSAPRRPARRPGVPSISGQLTTEDVVNWPEVGRLARRSPGSRSSSRSPWSMTPCGTTRWPA